MSWWERLFKKKEDNGMPTCTYCGGTEWLEGPSGGMSTNILCANNKCRHWFNFTPPPFNLMEDLSRIEPTQEEKMQERRAAAEKADTEKDKRRQEGFDAFNAGKSLNELRTSAAYGGYAEAANNIDRMAGFIDALAEQVRGTPR